MQQLNLSGGLSSKRDPFSKVLKIIHCKGARLMVWEEEGARPKLLLHIL